MWAGNLDGTRDSAPLGEDELFHDEEVEWVHQELSGLKARVLTGDLGSEVRKCVRVEAERPLVIAEALGYSYGNADVLPVK